MRPTEQKIVTGVTEMLAQLDQSFPAAGSSTEIARALVNMLQHGGDTRFLADHCVDGLELLQAGRSVGQKLRLSEVASDSRSPLPTRDLLRAEFSPDVLETHRDALAAAQAQLIEKLLRHAPRDPAVRDFAQRTSLWERQFYSHMFAPLPDTTQSQGPRFDAASIQTYLRERFPERSGLVVKSAKRLSGGFGRATILVELTEDLWGTREIVLRSELPNGILTLEGIDITSEFAILRMAFEDGVAAPEPLLLQADRHNPIGSRFIMVRKLPGRNHGSLWNPETISPTLLQNLMSGLLQVHQIDVRRYPQYLAASHLREWVKDATITQAIERWVRLWQVWTAKQTSSPIVTRAFHWLLSEVPQVADRPVLLHSDYALGNLLVDNDRITGVLDWEATHLGDPAEEVGWLGFVLRDQVEESTIREMYVRAGGTVVDDYRLRYFDVLSCIKLLASGFGAVARFKQSARGDPAFCMLMKLCLARSIDKVDGCIDRAEAARA